MDNSATELRKIKQTLQLLTVVAEQADEGIVMADLNGIVHFVNTAMAKMHGYLSGKELIGKMIDVFHSKDQMSTNVIPMIEGTKRKGWITRRIKHLRNDGTTFPTQTKMTLVKDRKDKPIGIIVFVTDMAERIQVEKSLTKQNFELATENENLQLQVNELVMANEQLQQQQTADCQRLEQVTMEDTEETDELIICPSKLLLDEKKLQSLAEMARRLSRRR